MSTGLPAHLLVVEDNPTTARTLRLLLEAQGYRVTWAADGRQGAACFAAGGVDLVLLDVMLPDGDGLTLCRAVRAGSAVPIVLLTARTGEDDLVAGLESGADDYVGKPFGAKVLLARIRRCLERAAGAGAPPGPANTALRVGELRLDPVRREVHVAGRPVRLTPREFALLHRLMENPGRVFTRAQLIAGALGPDFEGFDRTVDTHVWSLRRKLGEPRGRPRYILSEPGVGYRLDDSHAT